MERLTDSKRNSDGTASSKESLIDIEHDRPSAYCGEILTKLADYEDLEEQGRLIKLPCKVGDTIYYINPNENTINKLVIYSFDIRPLQRFASDYRGTRLNFNKFGKTVFLTKSEAEAKLAEMKKNESEE